MSDEPIQDSRPLSGAKAVALLVPLYLLILLPVIWQVRQVCLLDRDDCGYQGIIETIETSLLLQIACLFFVGILIFISVHVAIRARRGTLGVQQSDDEKTYGFNGLLITLVAYVTFLVVAIAVLIDASNSLKSMSIEAMESYFWKSYGALLGVSLVATILWHMNEYSARPAPKLLQAVLFVASLGGIYWIGRLPV